VDDEAKAKVTLVQLPWDMQACKRAAS
jgi:hypothetical protein